MKPQLRTVLLGALWVLAGCQAPPVVGPARPSSAIALTQATRDAVDEFLSGPMDDPYLRDWRAAIQQVAVDEHRQAYHLLVELIASARFDELSAAQRHTALLLAGLVGTEQNDVGYALRLLQRASAMSEAGRSDWDARLRAAYLTGQREEALLCLTTLARRWPQDAASLNPEVVREILRPDPQAEVESDAQVAALNALFDSSFRSQWGAEPSDLWERLAQALALRGDLDRALRVAARINSPNLLLALRVDRRFDALTQRDPKVFDLQAALQRQLKEATRGVERYPRSLDAVVQLLYAEMIATRFSDMLTLTDDVIAHVTDGGGLAAVYDDGPEQLNWIYDLRAEALWNLNRLDAAEREYRRSADRLEGGQRNVSNVINLGGFLARWNHGAQARIVLRELPQGPNGASPYGLMQVYSVRFKAAYGLHDAADMATCLTYLRVHEQDAPDVYQSALLLNGSMEEAAKLLVRRLTSPAQRTEALLDLQHYPEGVESPIGQEIDAQLELLLQRPDVSHALNAVGRRETVSFRRP